jgi:hypothetical protein
MSAVLFITAIVIFLVGPVSEQVKTLMHKENRD